MQLTLAIPNWNGATYLRSTLESLASQSKYVRWWFQDGVSTDDSLAIANEFVTSNDHIVSEPDSGQPDALNRAMRAMEGDIIGWINSDDLLVAGAALTVLQTFEAHPEVEVVVGEVEWIDAEGMVSGHHVGKIASLQQVLDIYQVWWAGKQWAQPEVFFRRSLWDRVGGINPRYDLAFDYELWTQFFLANAKVFYLPKVLTQFRRHSAQKSIRSYEAACEIRDIVRDALADADPRGHRIDLVWQRQLTTRLSYDRYQSGQDYPDLARRPGLATALLSHPEWLRLSEVRHRILRWRKSA